MTESTWELEGNIADLQNALAEALRERDAARAENERLRPIVAEVAETFICYRLTDGYKQPCRWENLRGEQWCLPCRARAELGAGRSR